jgi:WD40 repeat protein
LELLEHSPEKGVYLLQAEGDNLEISSAQFNPKQRLLVTGGNSYLATMWDLCREPNPKYGELQGRLPHVKCHTITETELQADVSSVHWSYDGSRLVTSSNDMMARIWKQDEETGHYNIESVKTFNMMLMNSKFNKPSD